MGERSPLHSLHLESSLGVRCLAPGPPPREEGGDWGEEREVELEVMGAVGGRGDSQG